MHHRVVIQQRWFSALLYGSEVPERIGKEGYVSGIDMNTDFSCFIGVMMMIATLAGPDINSFNTQLTREVLF